MMKLTKEELGLTHPLSPKEDKYLNQAKYIVTRNMSEEFRILANSYCDHATAESLLCSPQATRIMYKNTLHWLGRVKKKREFTPEQCLCAKYLKAGIKQALKKHDCN